MLIRVGDIAVINMTALDRVYIEPTDRTVDASSWNMQYHLVIRYEDMNQKQTEHVVWLGNNAEYGVNIIKEIVAQVREVEMENATTALENAIRRNDGEHSTGN